jgi:uncharacterized protein (DUF305 family)
MKNTNSWRKLFFICVVFLFSMQIILSQEMKMDEHHQMTASTKHIYLLMMDTMMNEMGNVPVTSIPDIDFMAQMIPHHQGAIEMAKYEISHGKNHEMIQLAKSILVEQTNDINAMKLLISQLPYNALKAGRSFDNAMVQSMMVMMKNMPSNNKLTDVDQAFAMVMIPHHRAAIDMAINLIQHSASKQVNTFAKQLISAEQIEIEQMYTFLK